MIRRALRITILIFLWVIALGCAVWALGALHYDFAKGERGIAWVFAAAIILALILFRRPLRNLAAVFLAFALVLAWWLTFKPSNDRNWQSDVTHLAWADINGDEIIFHNVRNCDSRTETDYTPHWETRNRAAFPNHRRSPWIAHPIVSFQFADAPPLCFSIEIRKIVLRLAASIGSIH